jgi:hypothetical protein
VRIRFVAARRAPVACGWRAVAGLPIVTHRLSETAMNPVASPRHPWKAFAAMLAMLALVHGARAHVFTHAADFGHVDVVHAAQFDDDCPEAEVDFGDGFPFDDDDSHRMPAIDSFDHDAD